MRTNTAVVMMITSIHVLVGCFSPTSTDSPPETASTELTGSSETSDTTSENTTGSDSTAASLSSSTNSSEDSGSAGCGDGIVDGDAGEECDDTESPNCSDLCTKTYRRVFITSESYSGQLGGIIGANEKCQAAANAVELKGVFHAWLSSTESSPATSFVQSSVPYRDLLGNEIVADWDGLISGTLKMGIFVTEKLEEPVPEVHPCNPIPVVVWSDTDVVGDLNNPMLTCMDWTSSEGDGNLGAGGYSNAAWTEGGCIAPCNIKAPLYCFEQ